MSSIIIYKSVNKCKTSEDIQAKVNKMVLTRSTPLQSIAFFDKKPPD